jgi:RNA polymerase sigma-70 factor (ECF subfamily)
MTESREAGSRPPQNVPKKEPMAAAANTLPNAAAQGAVLASAGLELETLFRRHQKLVMKSAYRITGSMNDAEDVLQTVFLRLAGRDFDSAMVGNIEGYLHRAAVNAALDLVRARQEGRKQALEDAPEPHATGAEASPERAQASVEIRAWLQQALTRLTPRAAEVFALRYLEEMDNHEIAEMLKVSETAVGVLLHRTRAQLQKDYRKNLRGEK